MNYLYEEADRIKMIEEYFRSNPIPIAKGKILDIENDVPETYDVYEMPMYFFVHNWNNGRHFLSTQEKIMSLGLDIKELDPVDNNKVIEDMLYESRKDKNDATKLNLNNFGQQEPIIATKNGVVIDGNRRFMLLKKIWREQKMDLKEQKIKAIILKKDYLPSELDALETKIQFRKESIVDYDPINKKIKIFNMYEEILHQSGLENKNEKFKNNINKKFSKDISESVGEPEAKIKEYIKLISFIKWFLDSKNANDLFPTFLNKDEQLKNLYRAIKNLRDSTEKFSESKMWFDGNKNIEEMLINAGMFQILYRVKAVGSFRDIMGSKTNWGVLKYEDLFHEWYTKTIDIVGNNILEFDSISESSLESKRKELEDLNKGILHKIYVKDTEGMNLVEEEINNQGEVYAEMQIQTAINFFSKRLQYFDSAKNISKNDKKQLEKISKTINQFLLKN